MPRAGVRTSQIRYHEDIGLLPEPQRIGGQRRYDESVLRRMTVIDVAQRAGLSLDEIRELVDAGSEPVSDQLRLLAERKLPEVDPARSPKENRELVVLSRNGRDVA